MKCQEGSHEHGEPCSNNATHKIGNGESAYFVCTECSKFYAEWLVAKIESDLQEKT